MFTFSQLFKTSLLIVLALLFACAPKGASTTPETTKSFPGGDDQSSDEPLIVYHRSGGFGGFDETWTIMADGAVAHSGRGSGRSLQLSSEQTDALLAAVRAADFAALDESYVSEDTCCDRFLYEITITLDGQTKTVRTIDAAPDQPERLTQLIDALNAALQ